MEIDPRGPRFGAVLTSVVLAVVLVTGSVWLLAAQALVFASGSAFGLRYAPYGWLYRSWSGLGWARLRRSNRRRRRGLPRRSAWPSRPSAWRATRRA